MKRPNLCSQLQSDPSGSLSKTVTEFLCQRRWFGGKARQTRAVKVQDIIPVGLLTFDVLLAFFRVEYAEGPSEMYSVPLVEATSDESRRETAAIRLQIEGEHEPIVLLDALSNESFLQFLLDAIANARSFAGEHGVIHAVPSATLSSLWQPSEGVLSSSLMKAEQSNSSIVYGKKLVLKLFRRLEEGISPDLEIGMFLTDRAFFPNTPAVAGYLEYVDRENHLHTLGILQAFVENQGDAWQFTLDSLAEYYRRAEHAGAEAPEVPCGGILSLTESRPPSQAQEVIGPYLEAARLLGQRTAELHLALNSVRDDPNFVPEPFRVSDQENFCDSAIALLSRTFDLVRQKLHTLPPSLQSSAQFVLNSEGLISRYFRSIAGLRPSGMRSRIHGDYHLGQILFTGKDFMLIDFEGEPARSLRERRAKRSPLQDVAGILRSFQYAAHTPLLAQMSTDQKRESLDSWARFWQRWVSAVFVKRYLTTSGAAPYLPSTADETEIYLAAFMLDKAIYELGYELNNRPSWVAIPLQGIADHLLESNRALHERQQL
ncbi:MAG TPA: putative maltokinase [Candidatus Angelobacter sp.]|nr:putative maltokinase [Candidatus Angelobacter sp.]